VPVTERRRTDHDALVERACDGDDGALAELVVLYHDRVYRYGRSVCREVDLDDAVQEAFVAFNRSRHTFRGDANLGSWLYTTVRNACRQMLRPIARRRRVLGEEVDPAALGHVPAQGAGPEEAAVRRELVDAVHDALARLEPSHRQILVLRDLDGLSGQATADQLGLSLPAMKSRLVRARAALRAEMLSRG
jgi:RNA polymerase sigma-70 factor (ECF subfamily)